MFLSPFEKTFIPNPRLLLKIVNIAIEAFLAVDFFSNFFVGYFDEVTLFIVNDPMLIAHKYATSQLIPDVVALIPFGLIKKYHLLFKVLDMVKIFKFFQIRAIVSRMEKNGKIHFFFLRFTKIVLLVMYWAHCWGCLFYLIFVYHPHGITNWVKEKVEDTPQTPDHNLFFWYFRAFYWSVTTFATVGYGDVHPYNIHETILAVVYMVSNFFFSCYVLGNFSNLTVHDSSRTKAFMKSIKAMSFLAKRYRFPKRIGEQMKSFLSLNFLLESDGALDLSNLESFQSYPKAIRSTFARYIFIPRLQNLYLFRDISFGFLNELALVLEFNYIPPCVDIIHRDETPSDFYIVIDGIVDFVTRGLNGAEVVVDNVTGGGIFGEICFFCQQPQIFTVRARTLVQLLRVDRKLFFDIIKGNAKDGTTFMSNILERIRRSHGAMMQRVFLDIDRRISFGEIDVPLGLHFAATLTDESLLEMLLRQGLDPNERDVNGRTPLHAAASSGILSAVRVLLEKNASPNSRDHDGSVPLWEAIKSRDQGVIRILSVHGARILDLDWQNYMALAAQLVNRDEIIRDLNEQILD